MPLRTSSVFVVLLATVGILALSSCGGGDSGIAVAPSTPGITRLSLEPASLSLIRGQSARLSVAAFGAGGNAVSAGSVVWSSSASQVASVDGTGLVTGVAAGTANIRAASGGQSATVLVQVAPPIQGDVAITDVQWTQGVQRDGNGGAFPMVEERAAAVSVVMRATAANTVPGQLVLRLTDAAGAVVHADTVIPGAVGSASLAAPSAQFLVPANVMRPGLLWEVTRDPRRAAPDDSSANDRFPRTGGASLRTLATSPLRIRLVPLTLAAHNNVTGQVRPEDIEAMFSLVRAAYPYARVEASIGEPVTIAVSFGTPPEGGSGPLFWGRAMQELDVARLADSNTGDSYWFGIVKAPPGFTRILSGGGGFVPANPRSSGPRTRTATAQEPGFFVQFQSGAERLAQLVAHELTHTLGRNHAPACGAGEVLDRGYPVPDGTIGTAGFYVNAWAAGLTRTAAPVAGSTPDVMGYCAGVPNWLSPYTYEAILAVAQSAPVSTTHASRGLALVVEGTVSPDGAVATRPVLPVDLRLDDNAGNLLVEALDEHGAVIATRRTAPVREAHESQGVQSFLATLPIRAGDEARVWEIRVSGAGVRPFARSAREQAVTPAPLRVSASVASRDGAQVRCEMPGTLAIMVSDAQTGRLIGRANGTTLTLRPPELRARIVVACSDGVRSLRVPVP